jgi:hypothetical protein
MANAPSYFMFKNGIKWNEFSLNSKILGYMKFEVEQLPVLIFELSSFKFKWIRYLIGLLKFYYVDVMPEKYIKDSISDSMNDQIWIGKSGVTPENHFTNIS